MQRLTVTLPDGVYTQLKRLAKAEGMPIKQYVACEITRHIELVEAGVPAINELIAKPNGTSESKELDAA
ncbi:MAG: hypothetical protein AAGC93_11060 [Cyanobacteria bacterium P01_F01_bin.53]